jgi:outer membrane protein assembly factor BamB
MEPPLSGGQPGDRGASLPWIITLPTRFYTPTVSVDGGAVYAGAWDGNVYALSAYDGTTAWTFNTGGRVRASPMPSPAGDLVVVGSTNGTLYGIGAADGQERWRSDALGGGIEGTAAFRRDGKVVFAGGGDGGLAALDSETGATLWNTPLGHSPLLAAPALSPDGETLVASCNTTLHALRTSSGARVWSAELASPVAYSTAVVSGEGDRVFVATEDGRVHALNTTTGGKLWSVHTQVRWPWLGLCGFVLGSGGGDVCRVPWAYPAGACGRSGDTSEQAHTQQPLLP